MDSGKVSGVRSRFSRTCSLLSQYMKENGGLGSVGLGFSSADAGSPEMRETLDLFPEKSGQNSPTGGEESPEGKTGQMTIFYGGQVLVFNDFPAEKANEIMTLATNFSAAVSGRSPAESASSSSNILHSFAISDNYHHPGLISDFPIARKHSLARFLAKRKDRITAAAPYQASKPMKAEPWLGLALDFPLH